MPETAAPRLHALGGDERGGRRAVAVPEDSLGVAGGGSERRAEAVPGDRVAGAGSERRAEAVPGDSLGVAGGGSERWAGAVPEDSLELLAAGAERTRGARVWAALWPKLAAVGLALALWELVVLSGWRPDYVLPGPAAVLGRLFADTLSGEVLVAAAITMKRALLGYAIALVVGVAIGLLMARVRVLRTAAGSLLTGLQTMPSVAWFPLAILLFQLSEAAILAVVVLGAAPSIANGLLHSFDQVPPLLVRAGRVLGARGLGLYRHIILPAALPGFLTGLKQGWAFAWRSLMAGELLVIIGHAPSIGVRLQFSRELSDAEGLLAWMIVVMILGVLVDGLVFGALERAVHRRRGLTGVHA